jgi:hypothetical protein
MLSMSAARVTKFEKPSLATLARDEAGSKAAQAIGHALEAHYSDLVQAPLPDKLLQLLSRLDDGQRGPKAKGNEDALG